MEDWPKVKVWLISRTLEGKKMPTPGKRIQVLPEDEPEADGKYELRSAGTTGVTIAAQDRTWYRVWLNLAGVFIERSPCV